MMKNDRTEWNKNWQKKNPEHARYLRYRSTARNFIKKHAMFEDVGELEELLEQRRKELSEN
ncbi:hypothetical protein YK48G_01310 [Lentilactobacillus fungorum]|uniref:Phage protein n=1 Tax=Lentilactobacillus fungorum TaxID=2201250 RepID=A0ABQ3VWY8_9LACO|nr:hypothetical protein [Lentilactobacillus fungorum]GHP12706.1 hypothetical protein YK48G_01310 [Lentilactobacillus fungorum]